MRIITSLLIFSISLASYCQRVEFKDPDLTFSFKKPKGWEVFDDGYVVKVSPSAQDSASIYFSITYFENAEPYGSFPTVQPADDNFEPSTETLQIAKETADLRKKNENDWQIRLYSFMKYGQRFEIKTVSSSEVHEPSFQKIIRSIKIYK